MQSTGHYNQYLLEYEISWFFSVSDLRGFHEMFRGYIFTAPKKFLAGETESGCLSLHNLEPPAHVLLELLSPASANDEEVLASTSTLLDSGKLIIGVSRNSHVLLLILTTLERRLIVALTKR